jgi:hypothetical protein
LPHFCDPTLHAASLARAWKLIAAQGMVGVLSENNSGGAREQQSGEFK